MKSEFAKIFAFLFVVPLLSGSVHAQDSLSIVILSPRVGEVINIRERQNFGLFPLAQTFDSAVVLRNSRGDYGAYIMRTTNQGSPYDTLIAYTEAALLNIAGKIDHLEEIDRGTYHPGENPASLMFGDASLIPERARQAVIPHFAPVTHSTSAEESRKTSVPTRQGLMTKVMTSSGEEYTGELLSVRRSELLLLTRKNVDDEHLPDCVNDINRIEVQDIVHVHADGHSDLLAGMGIGFAVGAVGGGAIGYACGDDKTGFFRLSAGDKALIGGVAGGVGGLVIGLISGISSSQGDVNIDHPQPGDLADLKSLSRFPFGEPLFLVNVK